MQGDVVHYTPTPGYVGPDSFSYTISDGRGGTDAATVSISVEAPVAIDDFAATRPGVPIDIEVLENEIEPGGFYPLFIAAASNPDGGTVAIHDGLITYSPDDGFHGADHFTYTVVDQFGNSSMPQLKSS